MLKEFHFFQITLKDNWCSKNRIRAILFCLCALSSHHAQQQLPIPYLHTYNCQNKNEVEVQTRFPYINIEMRVKFYIQLLNGTENYTYNKRWNATLKTFCLEYNIQMQTCCLKVIILHHFSHMFKYSAILITPKLNIL